MTIATSPSHLRIAVLIPCYNEEKTILDILRQVHVDDESNVGLVDAHAEGNGGNDDLGLVL